MNFKEFYEAAKAVDPKDTVSCEVKAARFPNSEGKHNEFEVFEISIWSGSLLKWFKGTQESCLAQYRLTVEQNRAAVKATTEEVMVTGAEAAELVEAKETKNPL